MRKGFAFGLLGLAAAVVAGVAVAQSPVDARKQGMQGMGRALATVVPMMRAQDQQPWNAQTAAAAMTVVRDAAAQIPGWFPAGSGAAPGVTTRALPAIWERRADFEGHARNLNTIAGEQLAFATAGNEAGFRQGFGRIGQVCGACHTGFRGP